MKTQSVSQYEYDLEPLTVISCPTLGGPHIFRGRPRGSEGVCLTVTEQSWH